jgi:Transposase DNA-binding
MRDFSIDYCNFGDKRLDSRFLTIIAQLSGFVGSSIPYCGVAWSQTKAIYRFLSNTHVNFEQILRVEQERVQHYVANSSPKVLYHIQDTTTLNYSDQKGRYDLGCLNYIDHRGFFLHSSVVLDDQKVMQGYLEADIYSRDPSTLGSSRQEATLAKSLPIEAKESYRWIRHFETFQALVSPIEGCHGINMTLTGFSKQDYFILASFLLVNYSVKLPQTENPTVKQFTNAIILVAGGNPKHNGIRQLWKGFAKADTIFKTAKAIRYE